MLFNRNFSNKKFRMLFTVLSMTSCIVFAGPIDDYIAGKAAYLADNLPEAMILLENAVAEDYAPAQALLAQILDAAEENERAVNLYQRSADQGNAEGQFGLATLYAIGEGVQRDYSLAVKYLKLSAEQGYPQAMLMLGESYLEGRLDIGIDTLAAQELIQAAADKGYKPAVSKLESLKK